MELDCMTTMDEVKAICNRALEQYSEYLNLSLDKHYIKNDYMDGRTVGKGLIAEMILNIISERENVIISHNN